MASRGRWSRRHGRLARTSITCIIATLSAITARRAFLSTNGSARFATACRRSPFRGWDFEAAFPPIRKQSEFRNRLSRRGLYSCAASRLTSSLLALHLSQRPPQILNLGGIGLHLRYAVELLPGKCSTRLN